ncbi:uncharacterized protein LOC116947811 isoform X5 [Petromyzon marinus]|uniref:uncharacterized protein LOC116947811 isoform X5 n=1 Tax=Petromyzon marinus TaxID=7757 RepID=UPI003F6FEF33
METVSPRDKKGPTLPAAVGLPTTRSSKRDLWLTSRRGWQATAVDLQAPPTTGSNATKVYLGHQSDSLNAHCTPRVSRVSELLCKRSEDPEEVLYNLGFGKDEPDVTTKIPARYFSSVSQARGINGQVLLASQLARLSGEHSGLERRFRQVRMLANVADTLNQIYSQVSGVHVPMLLPLVRTRSLFVQQEEGGREEDQCTSVGNIQRSGKTKVLNNDGETYRAGLHSAGAREFWGLPARTGSAHSDSSGYAEDPAVFDCSSAVHHQQSTDFLIGADSQTSQGIPFAPSCISEQLPCGSLLPPCDMRSWPHLGEAVPLADKYHRDGERIELKAHPAKSFYEQPRGLHFSAFEDFIGGSQTLKRTQNGSSDSLGNSLIYKVPQRNLFSSRTPNRQCTACQTEHVPSENDSVIADDECVATAPGDAQHHSLRERNKQRSVSTQTDSVDTSSTIRDAVPTACTFSHLPLRSHTMIVMGDHEKSCEFAVSSRGGMPETQDGTSGHQKFAYTSNNRVRLACVCAHHCECHLHLQRQCHHRMYPECIDCHKSCEPRVLFRSRSLDDLIMSRRGLHYSLIVQV